MSFAAHYEIKWNALYNIHNGWFSFYRSVYVHAAVYS